MEAVADGAEGVEVGEASGGEVVAIGGAAGVDGGEGGEAEFAGGLLEGGEGDGLDRTAFFGRAVEGAAEGEV